MCRIIKKNKELGPPGLGPPEIIKKVSSKNALRCFLFVHLLIRYSAYNSPLVGIVCVLDTLEMWGSHGGIDWASLRVEWLSRMPIHARFTA